MEPIFNEKITFEIKDENELLQIQVVNSFGEVVIKEFIDLKSHKEYSEMNQLIWLPLLSDESMPKLRIRLQYNYSDIQRYDFLLNQKNQEIKEVLDDHTQIDIYLKYMTDPFKCFA